MRYLKRFNESDQLYKQLDITEWEEISDRERTVRFEDKDISILDSFLRMYFSDADINISDREKRVIIDLSVDGVGHTIYVWKEEDDWFDVTILTSSEELWRCDTMDGLKKLLLDKLR